MPVARNYILVIYHPAHEYHYLPTGAASFSSTPTAQHRRDFHQVRPGSHYEVRLLPVAMERKLNGLRGRYRLAWHPGRNHIPESAVSYAAQQHGTSGDRDFGGEHSGGTGRSAPAR